MTQFSSDTYRVSKVHGVHIPSGSDPNLDDLPPLESQEGHLLTMLQRAADLSHGSDELLGLISDDFTRQHLSPERTNFLQPLRELLRGQILVTGAATGPVARFLAQFGEMVIAVEPGFPGAALAAARCRDLEHVRVYMGDGAGVYPGKTPFDVIVALPPADASVKPEHIFERLRRSLATGGVAILAVNNGLGMPSLLKAPGSLNHEWQVSRAGADQALRDAGFGYRKLFCAFPDGNFSRLMIHPDWPADLPGLETILAAGDESQPAGGANRRDSLWKSILTNGLLAHLSSSFVIVASLRPLTLSTGDERMWVYSTRRRKHFAKVLAFREVRGEMAVLCRPLFDDASAPWDSHVRRRPYDAPYVIGDPYLAGLQQILSRENWQAEDIAVWANRWLELLEAKAFDETFHGYIGALTHLRVLPPGYIDCIPDNIRVGSNGELFPIDFEYEAVAPIPIKYVIFRGLYQALSSVPAASLADPMFSNITALVLEIMRLAGYPLSEDELRNYVDIESSLQNSVAATPRARTAAGLRTAKLRFEAESNIPAVESNTGGDTLQLFWKTAGAEYQEVASASAAIFPGLDRQFISVTIPPVNPPPDSLRLDPCTRAGMFQLSAIRLFDAPGDCIWTWDGDGLGFLEKAFLSFADATFGGGAIAYSEGGDPKIGLPIRPEILDGLRTGGRLEVEMTWPEMPDLLQIGHRLMDGPVHRQRIRSLETEVQTLAGSLEREASLRTELEQAQHWKASLVETHERLTIEAAGYKEALAMLELQNNALRKDILRLDSLAETQQRLTAEAAGYKEALATLELKTTALTEENSRLGRLAETQQRLMAELTRCQEERTRLMRERNAFQQENERLVEEMQSLRLNSDQALISSNILNQEFQNQVSVMKEELANVRRERYALQVENRVLAAELERIDYLERRLDEMYQSRIWRTLVVLSSPFGFLLGRSKG